MTVTQRAFDEKDGRPITLYTLRNDRGFQVSCIDYGCIVTEILAPDRSGKMENVVLGFDTLEEYEKDVHFLGAVAGRFAGRIQNGEWEFDGETVQLSKNSHGHHLHGGSEGFHSAIWDARVIEDDNAVEFTRLSPDGEGGYPGNLTMTIRYTVKQDSDQLVISYSGKTDQPTLVNVTNHSYFNLSGDLKRDVLEHELKLPSGEYAELDEELLPTGKLLPVEDSVFDLRAGRKIKEATEADHPQTRIAGNGFDHPFVLDQSGGPIVLADSKSGRRLSVVTTEPAVVLYTGNGLSGPTLIRGIQARNHLGLCLETQKLPDSPHHPHFGSAVLEQGKDYFSETSYSFTVLE